LFLNDGLFSMTNLIYPEGKIKFLEVFSEGEILEINTLTCTKLKSIW
ncbi:MAG TPA: GH32 C-terminal domain-containing protein, partial [Candidatus Salinicoccus stercoripullorum]|nr:GH32 C-terminal domain-containing protein [Candidatus Salinicoccus stercoripullorum]